MELLILREGPSLKWDPDLKLISRVIDGAPLDPLCKNPLPYFAS